MLPVREDYRDYQPPAWVIKTVRQLLGSLSEEHVGGLAAIVLTESALVRKGRTHRVAGKKLELKKCRGFYCPKSHSDAAAVFLIVDNIIAGRPPKYWRTPFFRESHVGVVLFHEIGHHLNYTKRSVAAGQEASAEEWQRRLGGLHLRKKYWYLRPVIKPLRLMVGWLARRELAARSKTSVTHDPVRPGWGRV